ncbi:hypothetical protein [Empedobacter falsenii]|uniref:Lipoprotein n=1 Tax=Empedobacter falsenii TaxID=343874 RepID=A0AAW7DRB5_9FLAO|nr:hypothetical protein [Empedobacter falsenii]MDM1552856.1 hypothetical protein [Empedobacter falsenii]
MKKLGLLLSVIILFSCNDTKEKELQLKEKELELKEKQLRLDSIKALINTTVEVPEIKDSVVKEETLKVKESNGVGVKKLKFPKGQLNSKYTYEFRCDDDVWGKCQLLIKNNSQIIQRHFFNNTNNLVGDVKLIDEKYLYFYSEIAGGTAGNYYYYHFLINLLNSDIYKKELECVEWNHKECQLNDPLSILNSKYFYNESEDLF